MTVYTPLLYRNPVRPQVPLFEDQNPDAEAICNLYRRLVIGAAIAKECNFLDGIFLNKVFQVLRPL